MAVIPHPPYSPDLAPCDFFLFPKIKLKLNGCRFDTTEIKAELHRVLDTLIGKDFQEVFQKWRCETSVDMQEGTTSRVTAADRPYGRFCGFYSVSPENFGYHLVVQRNEHIFMILCNFSFFQSLVLHMKYHFF